MTRLMVWIGCGLFALVWLDEARAQHELCISIDGARTELSLPGRAPFHQTEAEVTEPRLIEVSDSTVLLALWNERRAGGAVTAWYGISLDGEAVGKVCETSYALKLNYQEFDPLREVIVPESLLMADASTQVFIVQFVTQPLSVFRERLRDLGVGIHQFLPNHAYVVAMTDTVKQQVEALPYVRWVGPFHPAFRINATLRERLVAGQGFDAEPYVVQVFERGLIQQGAVAERIVTMGGSVGAITEEALHFPADLTPRQVLAAVAWNEVAFVHRWEPPQPMMDIVRGASGAIYLERVPGSARTCAGYKWIRFA